MSSGRMSLRRSNDAGPTMTPHRVAALIVVSLLAGMAERVLADEPIEIFDAHLHYNWEPKPYYQPDEVLALLKKNRVTGILATSRPNTGTHALMDAKAEGL